MPCCPDGRTSVSVCVKYTVMIGALIHWLFAVAVIVAGAWALAENNAFYYTPIEDINDIIFNLAIMLIVCGSIMFIINICGFVGALRENTCLLSVFYIALLIIFLLEIVVVVLAFVFKEKVLTFVGDRMKDVYVDEYQDDFEGVMDHFQENYKCCGVDAYTDWNRNAYYNCNDENPSPQRCGVPYSCCKDPDELTPGLANAFCGADALDDASEQIEKIYTKGCLASVVEVAEQNYLLIGGICIAIAIPQLLGIFLGRRLAGQIKYQWEKYRRSQQRYRRSGGGHWDRRD